VYSDCRDIHYATIQELKNFRILQDVPNDFGGSKALLIMNKYFQKGMQFAITSPIEPWRYSLTHLTLLTHSLTHLTLLTHSLTHSPNLTHSLTHSLTVIPPHFKL
jgi:hypothetical protein